MLVENDSYNIISTLIAPNSEHSPGWNTLGLLRTEQVISIVHVILLVCLPVDVVTATR